MVNPDSGTYHIVAVEQISKVIRGRLRSEQRRREVEMCTLILVRGVLQGPDLFVIANRDEELSRPAQPPAVYTRGEMRILAPRDLKAGGTWIGVNEAGVFSGITNRFGRSSEPHHRSRGELVFEALESSTAREAAERIQGLSAADYNGFHLVIADRVGACIVWNDGATLHRVDLGAGYHVVTERSFQAGESARLRRVEKRLAGLGMSAWSEETRRRLKAWLNEEDRNEPLEGMCICVEGGTYGTRSSTMIEFNEEIGFEYSDGPPCRAKYREYGEKLKKS